MAEALTSPAWLLILLMVGLGKLFRTRGTFPPDAHETLNRYVIDVALPALVLISVQGLTLSTELVWLMAVPWALLALSVVTVLGLTRLTRADRGVTGALLLCIPLGNTAYLGYPLTEAMIGADAVRLAVIYDQFGTFLVLTTYGVIIAAIFGHGEQPTVAKITGQVVRFPPFIMLMIALLPIAWPPWVLEVARMIAATLVPTACLAVGLQLRLRVPGSLLPALGGGLAIKLLLMPLAAYYLLTIAGVGGDLQRVAVLQSAMPPMITAGALATSAGLDADLSAALVGFGIMVSFFTVPAVLAL